MIYRLIKKMQNKNIYEIDNLICSYNGINEVLKVKSLEIPAGKIIILLGVSGAGKSTILETLGLMSNSIKSGKVLFKPDNNSFNIGELWKSKNFSTLANIRRKYLSFIFQNTNLMPNFTAYENISITQMIEGHSKDEACEKAQKIANQLNLIINENKNTYEMSGGEKQRAAFIRAISPDYTVLFADEPTGNLDEENSKKLLGNLKKSIQQHKGTAIIVSHDINMALDYADQIIVLKKNQISDDVSCGEILKENVFNINDSEKRENWVDSNGNEINKPIKSKINEILNIEESKTQTVTEKPITSYRRFNIAVFSFFTFILDKIFKFNIHHDFINLFFSKEGKELLGHKNKNLFILIILLFLTFITIGLANGSLDYLKKKMDDPFVNFVDIEVPYFDTSRIPEIQYKLNNDSILKQKYCYKNVQGYNVFWLNFYGKNKRGKWGSFNFTGRTIGLNNPILSKIYDNKNLIIGRKFNSKMDYGLIVTHDLLKNIGLSSNVSHLSFYFNFDIEKNIDTISPIPIVAIVEELPGLSDFVTTPYFFSQRQIGHKTNPFNPIYTKKEIIFFTSMDSVMAYEFRNSLKKVINKIGIKNKYDANIDIYSNIESYKKGYNIKINFWIKPKADSLKIISNILKSHKDLKQYDFLQIYKYPFDSNINYQKYDFLTINFSKLDKIREFKEFFENEYGLTIDMAKVEAMENYHFITKLTRIISLILLCFSVLSICMFVANILTRHLEKIHMNIGTFKAFGIDNNTLLKIYMIITYMFIGVSMIISFLLSWLFGIVKGFNYLLSVFGLGIEKEQSYFNLFDIWTFIAIIVILVISFIVLYRCAGKILKKSPGDLIYSRI